MADRELLLSVRNVNLLYETVVPRRARHNSLIGVRALTDISFDAYRGDGIGIVGHNGAGKSTLLQVVAGFLRPNSGEVLAASQPTFLARGAGLRPALSGYQNIQLGLLANGLGRMEALARREEVAEFCELGEALHRPISGYSSGMKARLAFAVATAVSPDILLLDEALAVGDASFKQKALDRVRQIIAGSGLFLMATHAPKEIRKTCNRVLWLEGGSLVMDGSPDEVLPLFQEHMGGEAE